MKKLCGQINLIVCLLRILVNPNNTAAVLKVGEWLSKLGLHKYMIEQIQSQPECAEILKRRKLLAPVDLEKLQLLPLGTLGRTYADHMLTQSLNPNFFKKVDATSEPGFCMMRLRQTHDLWHVLTGFNTSLADELGLQAFMFSQISALLPAFLIGGAFIRAAFKDPILLRTFFRRVSQGYESGQKARPLFALDWEANWQTQIDQLRRDYLVTDLSKV